MVQPVVDFMGSLLGQSAFDRLFRRWDGKNLSRKGTLSCSFRLVSGFETGLSNRWRGYPTGVSDGHLWIGRNSVYLAEAHVQLMRPAGGRDLLDADFVIIPVTTASGAQIEWGLRARQVDQVTERLGSVRAD